MAVLGVAVFEDLDVDDGNTELFYINMKYVILVPNGQGSNVAGNIWVGPYAGDIQTNVIRQDVELAIRRELETQFGVVFGAPDTIRILFNFA